MNTHYSLEFLSVILHSCKLSRLACLHGKGFENLIQLRYASTNLNLLTESNTELNKNAVHCVPELSMMKIELRFNFFRTIPSTAIVKHLSILLKILECVTVSEKQNEIILLKIKKQLDL